MTEAEWMVCEDPKPMLEFLRYWPIERKLRLFACDCCRRLWHRTTELDRAVVAAIERCADGLIPAGKIFATAGVQPTFAGYPPTYYYVNGAEAERVIAEAGLQNAWTGAARARAFVVDAIRQDEGQAGRVAEWRRQSDALRCIFGIPFRPVAFNPEWRTDTAMALARQMYESRDFSAMPILADALQDAGCDNEDILSHCRGRQEGVAEEPAGGSPIRTEPHVRGCWVVDLVLGKQ